MAKTRLWLVSLAFVQPADLLGDTEEQVRSVLFDQIRDDPEVFVSGLRLEETDILVDEEDL